jgi:hypothetical protein
MLLFHTNDPKEIVTMHNGRKLVCKPDIVLVSLGAARNAFKQEGDTGSQNDSSRDTASRNDSSRDTASWDDYALKTAGDAPSMHFTWGNCFSAVEVKRNKSKRPPPKDYTVKSVKIIHPIYKVVGDRPAQEEGVQPSERAMPNPSKDAAPGFRKPQLTTSYQFY